MPGWSIAPLFVLLVSQVVVVGFHSEANGQPAPPSSALPSFPNLGLYSETLKLICGKQGVRWNPKELPWIGCFGLSSGSSATGVVAGHQLEIAVDVNGKEICKADGNVLVQTGPLGTNVPGIFGRPCNPLRFCVDEEGRDCQTSFDVLIRNPDHSVFFYFAQRIYGRAFVTNQENWDAEQSG